MESFNFRAHRKYNESPESQENKIVVHKTSWVGILLLVKVESLVAGQTSLQEQLETLEKIHTTSV